MRRWLALSVLFFGCGGPEPVVCPSLPVRPHATILFEPGLSGPGNYDVTAVVDGQSESCTMRLGTPIPAVHQGGMVGFSAQDGEMTCKSIRMSGHRDSGALAGVEVEGTPKSWSVKITQAGKTLVDAAFTPDYTPDVCGFVAPALSTPVL